MGYINNWNLTGAFTTSYDSINNRVNFSYGIMDVTLADSYAGETSTHYIYLAMNPTSLANSQSSALQSVSKSKGANSITWSGYMSLSTYRNSYLPTLVNGYSTTNFWYYEQSNSVPSHRLDFKMYQDSAGHYVNPKIINSVPVIPAAGTFTTSNVCLSGDSSVRINITSSSSNVQYWSIQRSATSGGTYTELTKQYPSGGTIYYDTTVNVLSTYWYKVVAHNLPWDEASAVQSIKVYAETNTPVLTGGTDISNYPNLGWSGITTSVNACSGATKQNWYQKPTTGSTYTRVASLDIVSGSPYSSFGLLPNVSYSIYSTFSGTSISGGETPASNVVTLTNTIVVPSISAVTTILSGCTVYNVVDINVPASPYATSYELWRSTTSGGTYTKISTGTTYILYDKTPVNNTTYWYKIKAVNAYWTLFGTPSSKLSVITLPIAPNLGATLDGYDVDLTWTDANIYQDNWEVERKLYGSNNFPTSNIKSFWKLDICSGATTADSCIDRRTGTNTNISQVTGKLGNGASFNGASSKIEFGNIYQFERTQTYSYSLWFKRQNNGTAIFPLITNIETDSSATGGIDAYILNNTLYLQILSHSSNGVRIIKTKTSFAVDTNWHNLIVTYNGSSSATGLLGYLDGSPIALATVNNNLSQSTVGSGILRLGYRNTGQYFNGIIDEVGIWSKVLSQTEVNYLYNGGNAMYYYAFELLGTTSSTAYSDANIDIGNQYTYRVRAKNDCNTPIVYSPYSNEINVAVDSIISAPTNCVATSIGYTGATLTWTNNNVSGVTANRILKWNGSSYDIFDTVPSGDTSYVLTNLTPNTTYRFIIQPYNLARTANSAEISFSTLDPSPYGLHTTNVNLIYTDIQWSLPAIPYGSHLEVRIKKITDSSYTTIATLNTSTTSYRLLGLIEGQEYSCAVVAIGSEYPSNIITFTVPTLVYSNAFCSGDNFIVLDATSCGVSNGVVLIPNVNYLYLYDFTLQNVDGTYYSINIDSFTNLPAGWYTLTATIKPQYSYLYFGDACVYEWIEIGDSNTNITLNSTKVKPAVCGGFGVSMGRIIYNMTDSSGATGWTFTIYDSYQNKVHQEVLTSIDTIVYLTKPGNYYGIIENNLGCTYLINLIEVESVSLNAVPEISELYLTPWDSTIEYNYYDSSNEDWYEAGIDTLQFSSTKIKEYLNLVDYWYQIELYTAKATYSQALNRSQNGLTFSEDITITIPKADNSKWKELASILTNRYIIAFKDANDNYWTMGYRSGCTVKSYQLSTNMYTITFNSPAVTKMITAIDVNYVNNHIK